MLEQLFRFPGDGWYPRIDENAEQVCFGNVASHAWHIGGGVWPGVEGRNSRFIRSGIVTFTREIDTLHATRWERDLRTNITLPTGENTGLVAGNDFDAANGRWASCLAAGRLVIDGVQIPSGDKFRGVQMAGDYLATTANDTHLVLFEAGVRIASRPLPPKANAFRVADRGMVTSGFFWESTLTWMTDAPQDITLSPWRQEGPPVLVAAPNGLWAWTFTHGSNRFGVIGMRVRPWNGEDKTSFDAIIIDGWDASTWLDAKFDTRRNRFVLAGSSDRGALEVWAVSLDHKQDNLRAWGGSLPKPEEPPPVPDPVDPPPPTEREPMRMTAAVAADILAFFRKFPPPRNNEGLQRERQEMLVKTIRKRHGPKWGWKKADSGRPPSSDALAGQEGGRLYIWDVLIDAGGERPEISDFVGDGVEGADVTGQVWIDVSPGEDFLDDVVDVDPGEPDQPDQPDQPPVDNTPEPAIEVLHAIHSQLVTMNQRLQAVEAASIRTADTIFDKANHVVSKIDELQRDVQALPRR